MNAGLFCFSTRCPGERMIIVHGSFFPAPGIYSSTEMLDFGTLRTQGKVTEAFMGLTYFLVAVRRHT